MTGATDRDGSAHVAEGLAPHITHDIEELLGARSVEASMASLIGLWKANSSLSQQKFFRTLVSSSDISFLIEVNTFLVLLALQGLEHTPGSSVSCACSKDGMLLAKLQVWLHLSRAGGRL